MVEYGITTLVLAGANAPDQPEPEADTDNDDTVETEADEQVPNHPARESVSFQQHTQSGSREVVRGLPSSLPTNALRSGRRVTRSAKTP